MKEQGEPNFYWQSGYAAFSVSESMVPTVTEYIRNQEVHHRTLSFQEELRAMLSKHNMEFDEQFLWE